MSKEEYNPKILGFLCNWCCYAAADAAGVSRYQYPPLASWNEFERLCRDLFKNDWNSRITSLNGRNGSRQNGVDIYRYPGGGQEIWGVQCKGKEIYPEKKITIDKIEDEIDEALGFEPVLSHYIFATTMRRDVKLQRDLRKLVRRIDLPFSVEIVFWDDIEDMIADMPDIQRKYYPNHSDQTESLYQRAGFNERRRSVNVFAGLDQDEFVFDSTSRDLRGYANDTHVSIALGWNGYVLPRTGKRLDPVKIDVEAICDLIEDFNEEDIVEFFKIDFNLINGDGSISTKTDSAYLMGHYHIRNDVVYNDESISLIEDEQKIYMELFREMRILAQRVTKR